MNQKTSILLLEDDPEWVQFVKDGLGDDYEVINAETLTDARRWLQAKNFRLAIVDLNLDESIPDDRSGFELVDQLSHTELMRDMSVIILSQFDSSDELRKAFKEFRVHDYISKKKFDQMPFKTIVEEAIAASYGG